MNLQRFYTISEKNVEGYYAYATSKVISSKPCSKCGRIKLRYNLPMIYEIHGKRLADIFYMPCCAILISERAAELLASHNVTGVNFCDAECSKWFETNGKIIDMPIPKYKYLDITGRCGDILLKNGVKPPECDECGAINVPIGLQYAFNIKQWDGSDFFTCENHTGYVICSEKIKEIVEKNKLKNFMISSFRYVNL